MFKWIFAAALVAGLYQLVIGIGGLRGDDAALVIAGFAGLYGLFLIGFFMRDSN